MATQVDILVGIHRIVVAERTEYVVRVQTFARKLDFAPRYVPFAGSSRRRFASWVVGGAFVVGFFFSVWLVFVR